MNPIIRIKESQQLFFSSPSKIIDVLSRFGCWQVLIAQFFLVDWLSKSFFIKDWIVPLILGEVLFIAALQSLRAMCLIRDMIDISVATLFYIFVIVICHEFSWEYYSVLTDNWKFVSRFFLIVAALRLAWSFKDSSSGANFAWPVIGPFGLLLGDKNYSPIVRSRKHSLLVYLSLGNAWLWSRQTIYDEWNLQRLLIGLISLLLYFKYFHRYMYENVSVVEELDSTKKELATTKEVLADVAEAKTAAEIELEEQRMLATLANKFSRDQIATLHEFTLMDREMQMRFNNAIRAARTEQLKEEAENELKQKRANLRLVVSDLDDTQ